MKLTTYKITNKKFSYNSHHYSDSVELHQLTVHEIHCSKKNQCYLDKETEQVCKFNTYFQLL